MVAVRGLGGPTEKVWVAKGKAPRFHDDRAIDQLMAMITALTAEVSILRERLDTHERLAERHRLYSREEVETYQPDAAAAKDRTAQRQRLLKKVYRVLKEDLARFKMNGDESRSRSRAFRNQRRLTQGHHHVDRQRQHARAASDDAEGHPRRSGRTAVCRGFENVHRS